MNDMNRILELPRMEWTPEEVEELRDKWTARFRVPGGEWRFNPDQATSLEEASITKAALLPITTGGGKTLLSMVLPFAVGIAPERTVVLCPPGLEEEAALEREKYLRHFDLGEKGPIYVPYSRLSREAGITLLDTLAPDLIIADEAHNLRNKDAARTNRFLMYMHANPHVRFVAMSATFSTSALVDFGHLSALALREGSPLPLHWPTLATWGRCIDAQPQIPPSGMDWHFVRPLMDAFGSEGQTGREIARSALQARMMSTPGVVVSDGDSCDRALYCEHVKLPVPPSIEIAVSHLREYGELPNGSEIDTPMHVVGAWKQLSMGFFYYPDWPNGEVDTVWLKRKRDFNRELYAYAGLGKKGLDTPFLVERALAEKKITHTALNRAWEAWKEVRFRLAPPRATDWVDDSVLRSIVELALNMPGPTLLWIDHTAVADKLREWGIEVARLNKRPGPPPANGVMGVHIRSHATGYNLQEYTYNVIASPPSNAALWQQLLGRTHRNGQAQDVHVTVLQHSRPYRKAWSTSRVQAKYIEETFGLIQKLNHLEWKAPESCENELDNEMDGL